MDAISGAASSKATAIITTTTAGGVVASGFKPDMAGSTLYENGLVFVNWHIPHAVNYVNSGDGVFINWVGIMQIIGSIYITMQLIKLLISAIQNTRDAIMPNKPIKPLVVNNPKPKPKPPKSK